ncbi:type II toxin-antitoxin system HicB family antitoxin [bacterium]|nr:type II toxin-antitoxin system HicB family antitoxin [bacterium]
MILKFEAYHDGEFWCARAVGESIFTQGETLDELTENIKEAVSLHFEEELEQNRNIPILLLSELEVTHATEVAAS